MSTVSETFTLPARVHERKDGRVGQLSQFYGLYARELIKTFRNPWVIAITLIQPFMWLAFFGGMLSQVPTADLDATLLHAPPGTGYLAFLLPGVLATGMMAIGMFGAMSTIQDKRFGFMKRILITPTSKATVYLTKAFGSATRGLVQIPVMIAAAVAFGVQLHGDPLAWAAWILGLVFLGVGFSALFLAITSSSTDWQTPGVISNFITMPLMFASGAMFPATIYPSWMQAIADVNPVGFSAQLSRSVLTYGQFTATDVTYLGYLALFAFVMVAVGTVLASRYLKVE
jgi:ABC-2 type transport system permease protein